MIGTTDIYMVMERSFPVEQKAGWGDCSNPCRKIINSTIQLAAIAPPYSLTTGKGRHDTSVNGQGGL